MGNRKLSLNFYMPQKWEGEGKEQQSVEKMAAFFPYLLCLCSWVRGTETFCSSALPAQVIICGRFLRSSSDSQDASATAGMAAAICPVWIVLPKGIMHKLNNKTAAEILLFVWLHSI